VTDEITAGVTTTKLWLVLVNVLVPQFPVPPVVAAVTVNGVVLDGVLPSVVMVNVEVVELFETVVGLKVATASIGAVQLIASGAEVQVVLPAHVVLIK
jgi:hypothetical protein